jgi:3'(2'), 5'-bisphosphate nucleotidase
MLLKQELIRKLLHTVHQAGDACLKIYESDDFGVEHKEDNSPVTVADLTVNRILTEELERLTPEIPVVSEEAQVPYETRKDFDRYWIIDPIDGTKEFIRKTGEFTINLGLVENGYPTFGIIYIPITREMFWGGQQIEPINVRDANWTPVAGRAAFVRKYRAPKTHLAYTTSEVQARVPNSKWLDITCSKDHRHPNDIKFIFNIGQDFYIRLKPCGSTIKICRIAEGVADVYIRTSGINDWDLAAGHAIIEAAGGHVTTPDGRKLVYNTEQQKLEPFIVYGNIDRTWEKWLPND